MAGFVLDADDFRLPIMTIVNGAQGLEAQTAPFGLRDMPPVRRNNPAWVDRTTPVFERINRIIESDPRVRMKVMEMKGLVRAKVRDNPAVTRAELFEDDDLALANDDVAYTLGNVLHESDPYMSYLTLYVFARAPGFTLADFDAVLERGVQMRELSQEKYKVRRSSVGGEVKEDAELPFGSREEIEEKKRKAAETLVERTQAAQAAAGNPLGYREPVGTQPRRPVDDSDAMTVRHVGPPSRPRQPIGSGKPADLQFAKSAYQNAPQEIDGATLVKETPTLKFYKQGQNITIAVRGTRDWMDWLSNASLASQYRPLFQLSPRVRKDVADIKDFQRHFPPSEFHYRGVGHSLGGAIIDELIKQNLISEGRSFNPAIHRRDLGVSEDKNERTYNPGDPLYLLKTFAEGASDLAKGHSLAKPLPQHIPPPSILLENHKLASFNGSGKEDNKSSDPEDYAYSDADIRESVGSVPIHRYPDLKAMASPDALFKGNKAAVLLFLTEGKSSGHWLVVLDHDDHYEVFDSFGVAIDGNRKWLDKEQLQEFGQTLPLLSILLEKGNKPVNHNSTKLQLDSNDTCGRWVVWRIKNAHMPLKDFVDEMTSGSGTPDQKVVRCTFDILGK
jgi:hypothetical protein